MPDDVLYPSRFVSELLGYETTATPALTTTMAEFLDEYTLHDSYWIGLGVGHDVADLLIRFDAHWSDGRIPHPGPNVQKWPLLTITMNQLTAANFDFSGEEWDNNILEVRSGGGIDRKSTTKFSFFDGTVDLVHDEPVDLRMIGADGGYIPIPFPAEAARAVPEDPIDLPDEVGQRLRIARSMRASPRVLERLLSDEDAEVRIAAVTHRHTPPEAVERLLVNETDKKVARAAHKRLRWKAKIRRRR